MIQFIHRHLSFATPYSFGVDQLQGSATICFVTSCGQWQPVATTERIPSRQIEESISILNFFPPNRGVDFYFDFLPAKTRSRFSFILHTHTMVAGCTVTPATGGRAREGPNTDTIDTIDPTYLATELEGRSASSSKWRVKFLLTYLVNCVGIW